MNWEKIMFYIKRILILKLLLIFFFILSSMSLNYPSDDNIKSSDYLSNLTLLTTNTWYEFNFDCAWLWMITLKSKKVLKLTKMVLQWSGENLNTKQLTASLYQKKETDFYPIPIEENFVCDGFWNKEKQQIIFEPNKKVIAVNKYYLVLSFPKAFRAKLKTGIFKISDTNSLELKRIK
ncbi:hypothetical protein GF322_04745 [Candidatus Dependentiae bacterium]|nr:hypothetical protein [Candidatus Dependentiae bacterium]